MKQRLIRPLVIFLLFSAIPIIAFNCKPKCSGVNQRKELYISSDVKNSLASFQQGTSWIFQCTSTSEKDTIIINANPNLPMTEGSCVDSKDCCSKYYYQHLEPTFQVKSISGLNNFSGYVIEPSGFWMKGSWGAIPIYSGDIQSGTYPSGTFTSTLVLSIIGKTLNDVELGGQYKDDNTPDYCYWSKQYGLVKYSYKTITGTILKEYERVDLP